MAGRQQRLGNLLLEMEFIDAARLEAALNEQERTGKRLGKILVESGAINEERLVRALSRQLGVDACDPIMASVHPRVLGRVPAEIAFRHRVIPIALRKDEGCETLFLATPDPLDPVPADVLRAHLGENVRVKWFIAGETEIELALARHYGMAAPPAPASATSRIPVPELELGPGPGGFDAISVDLSPSLDIHPPSVDLRSPSLDIHPPSLDLRPPSLDIHPPSLDLRPFSVERSLSASPVAFHGSRLSASWGDLVPDGTLPSGIPADAEGGVYEVPIRTKSAFGDPERALPAFPEPTPDESFDEEIVESEPPSAVLGGVERVAAEGDEPVSAMGNVEIGSSAVLESQPPRIAEGAALDLPDATDDIVPASAFESLAGPALAPAAIALKQAHEVLKLFIAGTLRDEQTKDWALRVLAAGLMEAGLLEGDALARALVRVQRADQDPSFSEDDALQRPSEKS